MLFPMSTSANSLDGKTVVASLGIGVASLALILLFQRFLPRIPGVLVAVVLAIGAVGLFDLTARGVKVVGPLPEGFPPLTIPIVPVAPVITTRICPASLTRSNSVCGSTLRSITVTDGYVKHNKVYR